MTSGTEFSFSIIFYSKGYFASDIVNCIIKTLLLYFGKKICTIVIYLFIIFPSSVQLQKRSLEVEKNDYLLLRAVLCGKHFPV